MKIEKTNQPVLIITAVLILVGILISPCVLAGSLDPSAAPAPTMKTLDQVEPRIAIAGSDSATSVYSITESGSYYLTGNRNCSAVGIVIDTADNVTIDLMGYSIIGPGATSNEDGILLNDSSNVEIKNGTVKGFFRGIYEDSPGQGNRVIDVRVTGNRISGIELNSVGDLIRGCTVIGNGVSATFTAYGISAGRGSTIIDNVVTGNASAATSFMGIFVEVGSTVKNNTVTYNASSATTPCFGIRTYEYCTVTGNTTSNNGYNASGNFYGIYTEQGCTVTNNSSGYNGFTGSGTAYGIYLNGASLVDQNTAYYNQGNNMNTCATCTFGVNNAP